MSKTAIRSLITSGLLLVAVAGLAWVSGDSVRSSPVAVVTTTATAEPPEPVSPESLATEHRSETDVPTATATGQPELKPVVTSTSQVGSPPAPTVSPTDAPVQSREETIGFSVAGRPIVAHRFGAGPIKIALVGNIHGGFEANTHVLAQGLIDHFRTSPTDVPTDVSLWIVPTMNPDGLATGHRWNSNDVDLNRNSDTDLDGCAGNDWSADTVGLEGPHPGAGGPHPFSEPELRAVRDFLDDAWVAVLYHSAAEAIYLDTCQRHLPTEHLAELLSDGSGYPIAREGWSAYPITGDFGDYLAGQDIAAVAVELTDHDNSETERNLAGVLSVLQGVADIITAEAGSVGAELVLLDEGNTGTLAFPVDSLIHPLALEVLEDIAYVLDGGRVLALRLADQAVVHVVLEAGDEVQGTRVLEPIDLALDGSSLLVLDRAGDVYRLGRGGEWSLVRYDRPSRDTSDHYYVALDSNEGVHYLLETTREQVWRFENGALGSPWVGLPKSRDVDLAGWGSDLFVLTRRMNGPQGQLLRYRAGKRVTAFSPNVDIFGPRQVRSSGEAIYVLDGAGRRVLAIDREDGGLETAYQFADRRRISALWIAPDGQRLVLAGRDALYFVGEANLAAEVEGGAALAGHQPHDLELLDTLGGLLMPIDGARLTSRDFQMPGAPRHYRFGVHEGIDFYGHTVGVTVNRRTPVRAVADGRVVRALVDYQAPTRAQASRWHEESQQAGYTPDAVLDGYRGMQVWIEHEGGLVSKYAHLGSIAPDIVQGAWVSRGQILGTVGNSGTPASTASRSADVHLHMELWLDDHYVGQYLRPIETRELLGRMLQ